MIIKVDEQGKQVIDMLIQAGLKSGAFHHQDIQTLAAIQRSITLLMDEPKEEVK